MKTLLLTSAAAVAIAFAPNAFAEHRTHDHDGQESVAFGYGTFGNSWNHSGYGRFMPGYAPLNSGWTVGAFNPTWNGSCRSGYNPGSTWNGGFQTLPYPNSGYGQPQWTQPQILPGGCFQTGGQFICPTSGRYRIHSPYGEFGYGNLR